MLVLNKKAKIVMMVLAFILIAAAGYAVEYFEKDAFIAETVATEDALPYTADAETPDNGRININSAGIDELDKLNGIGDSLAERIIKYREENGPFMSVEEIMKVSGISNKKFEDIKDFICTE